MKDRRSSSTVASNRRSSIASHVKNFNVASTLIEKEQSINYPSPVRTLLAKSSVDGGVKAVVSKRKFLRHTTVHKFERQQPAAPVVPKPPPPRTETRLAIRKFKQLYNGEIDQSVHANEYGLSPGPAMCDTPEIEREKMNELLHADAVGSLGLPQMMEQTKWNIKNVQNHYGWGGRLKFMSSVRKFHKIQQVDNKLESIIKENPAVPSSEEIVDGEEGIADPVRADKYIQKCLEVGILPEPFIVPKSTTCSINLAHYGVGNKPVMAMSACFNDMPRLEGINLRNNRLSDSTLSHILRESKFSRLLSMDISNNTIGKNGVDALANLIGSTLVLKKLLLSDCRLSDRNFHVISNSLVQNTSLLELDLSKNKLSDCSGNQLQKYLSSTSTLERLDLSWNNIRSMGAHKIANALKKNSSLKKLNFEWNGIDNNNCATYNGAMNFGSMLRYNNTIQYLSLAGNSIKGQACMAIMNGWVGNKSLELLVVDDNPVGRAGARSIFRALSNPVVKTCGRLVQFNRCNLDIVEECMFDPRTMGGNYDINLESCTEFWIVFEAVRQLHTIRLTSISEVIHLVDGKSNTLSFQRLKEHEEDIGFLAIKNKNGIEVWNIPLIGKLHFKYERRIVAPTISEAISEDIMTLFLNMIRQLDFNAEKLRMMKLISFDHFLSAAQAKQMLYYISHIENHQHELEFIINSVADTENLVSNKKNMLANLNEQRLELLQKYAGQLKFFDPHLPNGHYTLDLKTTTDISILTRLMILSSDNKLKNKHQNGVNTSQTGNWECFRNEKLNGTPIVLSSLDELPKSGIIEFDFITTKRDVKDVHPISDSLLNLKIKDLSMKKQKMSISKLKAVGCKGIMKAVEGNETLGAKTNPYQSFFLAKEIRNHEREQIRELKLLFSHSFLMAKQLFEVSHVFKDREFGQVECVVSVYNRVIDIGEVLRLAKIMLSPMEVQELIKKIGWLNIWNPIYAEMEYTLDLSVWEDREITILLARLGDIEPGENWIDETYNNIPGWELPQSWVDGKVATSGILVVKYYSGENNRFANYSSRKEMMASTLCGKPLTEFKEHLEYSTKSVAPRRAVDKAISTNLNRLSKLNSHVDSTIRE